MKNVMNKMKDFLMPQDEFEDDYEDEEVEEIDYRAEQQNVVKHRQIAPLTTPHPKLVPVTGQNTGGKMEILNFTMANYDMTVEVFGYIKNRKSIIVNMQQLNSADVQRAVDYLTGACYALNGSVDKVAENIFVFTPENVNLTADKIKQKNVWPLQQ